MNAAFELHRRDQAKRLEISNRTAESLGPFSELVNVIFRVVLDDLSPFVDLRKAVRQIKLFGPWQVFTGEEIEMVDSKPA